MRDLSSEAVNQLRRNARSVVRELGLLNDAYCEIGVTLAERHLLIELSECRSNEPPTMGEIAERLLLDKSTVSRLISKAVKKEYVECIADKKDKRKRFLQLTENGKWVLDAFEPIAFNHTKEALLALTPEEARTVFQGVALYAKGLRNSRLQTPAKDRNATLESLVEIFEQLNHLGCVLEPFDQKDEEGLYQIFQEVVDSDSQFSWPYFKSPGHVYVCRSKAGEVIGGFYIRPNFSGRSSHIANAAYMIKDAYRGKGIGSLLVKSSLRLAQDLGFQAMQFNMVLSGNATALRLYEKLGFNTIGTIPEAVRNQDGYVMYRKL